ncbi:MAG: outer membrane protein assembly factor BamE [Proteobacteria bacterium]|nr:outer membrane protein assembly factor BamE [Pseudomonadota bacterium]
MRLLPLALAVLTAASLAACAPVLNKRGNLLEEEQIRQIKIGETTREDVTKILGSPTQTSTFDDKIWYYIGQNTEQTSFFDPEITQQKLVAIQFTPEGKVAKISRGGLKYAENIEPNPDKTPTYGKEVSLMQQLLGNLGRPSVPGGDTNKPTGNTGHY